MSQGISPAPPTMGYTVPPAFQMNRRERRAYAAGRWVRFVWLRREYFRRRVHHLF